MENVRKNKMTRFFSIAFAIIVAVAFIGQVGKNGTPDDARAQTITNMRSTKILRVCMDAILTAPDVQPHYACVQGLDVYEELTDEELSLAGRGVKFYKSCIGDAGHYDDATRRSCARRAIESEG